MPAYYLHLVLMLLVTVFSTRESAVSPSRSQLMEIGEYLFFDPALSASGKISCSTCHNPELAFTDGYRRSFNAYGEALATNTPSLLNVSDNLFFHSSDQDITSLKRQLEGPFGNEHPEEMGYTQNQIRINPKIQKTLEDRGWWKGSSMDISGIIKQSLVTYVSSLNSRKSRWDEFLCGDYLPTPLEYKGMKLYYGNKLGCSTCHGGADFDVPENQIYFRDVRQQGYDVKIPSLRNVAITSPYFIDGSETKLRSVILGHGIDVQDDEMMALISFLEMLTERDYENNYYNRS